MSESQQVAASYIYTFYTDVQSLNHWFANYSNIMAYLKNKYPVVDDRKQYDDTDKQNLNDTITNLRYFCTKCYISYQSMIDTVGSDKRTEAAWDKLSEGYAPVVKDAELYVIALNRLILRNSLQDLMRTSASIVSQMFNDRPANKEADN